MDQIELPGKKPIADELYEYLRLAIMRGEFAAGERVVEEIVAARAGVSRTPAGQALRRLQSVDLLRASPQGLVVNELSIDELAEACTVRDALEALAAQLAASSRSELDLGLLDELNRQFESAIGGDIEYVLELNHAFHDAVWDAARNNFLKRNLLHTRSIIERLDSTTLRTVDRQREALAEHQAIAAAIASRDPDAAHAAAFDHFRKATSIRIISQRTSVYRSRGQN